jgi:two-component system, chemotaxis family, sensor kinase CheA
MDELLEQFLIEGRDLIAQAHADLEMLAADPAHAAAIDGAFRAVHTLKGSVAIFAMEPAERLLHAAEDLLDAARKGRTAIDQDAHAALVAFIDQTDRWIDDLEQSGALPDDAGEVAIALLATLNDAGGETRRRSRHVASAPWLTRLAAREAATIEQAGAALTAFRYEPDADCFFRGDDPLALVAAVPDLIALTILPVEAWPELDDIEPFRCALVLEGLSAASEASVREAFRLAPDQVSLAAVSPEALGAQRGEQRQRLMRVDPARLDQLSNVVGELSVAINALAPIAEAADQAAPQLGAAVRAAQTEIERIAGGIRQSVATVRLVSLAASLRRLPRVVREVAGVLGKQVRFELRGETLEVDKEIADGLFEPLLHLIRNAVDHGIEDPDAREQAGKAREGLLKLGVRREADDVVIALSDDGAGIDVRRVRDIAVAHGLLDREAADALSDAQATRLIFAPGFSTAGAVSDLSGRGVGMDAVQTAVDRLRGRIEIESERGRGTSFRLVLPLNAITTRLLIVNVGESRFAVPLDQVVETARIDAERLMPLGLGTACVLRDRTVPVLDLGALLGAETAPSSIARLLVTRAGDERVALRVDGMGRRIDALVKEKSRLLSGLPSIAGTTVLGNGEVLLVLDLPELVG